MLDNRIRFLVAAIVSALLISGCSSDDSDLVAGSSDGAYCYAELTKTTYYYEIIGNSMTVEDVTGESVVLERVSEAGGLPVFGRWRTDPMRGPGMRVVGIFDFSEGSIAKTAACEYNGESLSASVSGAAAYTDTEITVLDEKKDMKYFE